MVRWQGRAEPVIYSRSHQRDYPQLVLLDSLDSPSPSMPWFRGIAASKVDDDGPYTKLLRSHLQEAQDGRCLRWTFFKRAQDAFENLARSTGFMTSLQCAMIETRNLARDCATSLLPNLLIGQIRVKLERSLDSETSRFHDARQLKPWAILAPLKLLLPIERQIEATEPDR